jgi:hypothetical protein
MAKKTRYKPNIRVQRQFFPGKEWKVPNEWEWHLQNYLKTPADSTAPYAELHAAMRKHGIDWFHVGRENMRKYRTDEQRRNISEGMKANPIWNRRLTTGLYYWRDKTEKPNVREWAIMVNGQFLIVKNLKAWSRTVGLSYDVLIGKIRFQSWPYIPRAGINIEHIRKWS